MANIFNNKVAKNLDTREFLNSTDLDALRLKNEIFYSAKLALHVCIDKFIMYDLEIPKGQELFDLIQSEDGGWFLGGEEFMWNSAIERGLPKLERIIRKNDQYFIHQLKYGKSEESKFSVFQFRREVVRAIWANLNMELLYYTNANDERFSI